LRIVLVRKPGAQMTSFVSPALYAPGEQRRSGFGPSLQPLVAVRRASRTVAPSVIDGRPAGAGDVSHRATPPWCEQVPDRVRDTL
jgi:hypothetical protein